MKLIQLVPSISAETHEIPADATEKLIILNQNFGPKRHIFDVLAKIYWLLLGLGNRGEVYFLGFLYSAGQVARPSDGPGCVQKAKSAKN